jgi:micrococcal nuclease
MKIKIPPPSVALLCLILCLAFSVVAQETFTAKVVGVIDGDTITVLTKEKRQIMLRLTGIDAPEMEQEFGAEARRFLTNLVLNQTVIISSVKKDCLDRKTGSVVFNNSDLSLSVVKSGNAWADTSCGGETNDALTKEEASAREKKVGLWQNSNDPPVNPAEFRRKIQQEKQAKDTPPPTPPARQIYEGLAPATPILTADGKESDLSIGMSLDSFLNICGEATGKRSKIYTTEYSESFDITVPPTRANTALGCDGTFTFRRTAEKPNFRLSSTIR